jgi:hypothetical protein
MVEITISLDSYEEAVLKEYVECNKFPSMEAAVLDYIRNDLGRKYGPAGC